MIGLGHNDPLWWSYLSRYQSGNNNEHHVVLVWSTNSRQCSGALWINLFPIHIQSLNKMQNSNQDSRSSREQTWLHFSSDCLTFQSKCLMGYTLGQNTTFDPIILFE